MDPQLFPPGYLQLDALDPNPYGRFELRIRWILTYAPDERLREYVTDALEHLDRDHDLNAGHDEDDD